MTKMIIRCILLSVLILLQVSFFPSLFARYQVPNVVLIAILGWTAVVGFEELWILIIIIGLMVDIMTFQRVGITSIEFILAAYVVSFLSRRFVLEHRGWGIAVLVGSVGALALIQTVASDSVALFFQGNRLSLYLPAGRLLLALAIENILIFMILYPSLIQLERFLSFYDKRIQLK